MFTTSAAAAARIDHRGYDIAPVPPGARAVTTPGYPSPSAGTRRQVRAGDAAPPSSGLTTPER